MNIQITSRRFKVHDTLKKHIIHELEKLQRFYDGIIGCDVVLYFEKPQNSDKYCEITMKVQKTTLVSTAHSEDFIKSVDMAIEKMERQLKKYKGKLREKDRDALRQAKSEV